MFFNFAVARNGLQYTGYGVAVPIVLAPVADENAAEAFDLADKIDTFHATSRSSTFRMPGICPLVRSW